MITTLKIASFHNTLAEAVAVAKPDLSYNKGAAENNIKMVDRDIWEAYVMENGDIYTVSQFDIKVLNKWNPFHSVMSGGNFSVAVFEGKTLNIVETSIPKNREGRKIFAKNNFIAA